MSTKLKLESYSSHFSISLCRGWGYFFGAAKIGFFKNFRAFATEVNPLQGIFFIPVPHDIEPCNGINVLP